MADCIAVAERREHLVDFLRFQFSTGPDGRSASTSLAGLSALRRLASHPGSGSMIGRCRAAPGVIFFQPRQHIEVFLLDDGPRVVLLKELAPIGAERRIQSPALGDGAKRFDELRLGLVIESGLAADALAAQHFAPAVGQHGLAQRPRFERHHREAFII